MGGDLKGITRRLPHIASLGVDCIWLSPIFTSPQKDMGYDVSNYIDIDPLFGTLDNFDALIARAHELGLKVITDQVLSHTSDQHPWFKESRQSRDNDKADWYVWANPLSDGSPPTNWHSLWRTGVGIRPPAWPVLPAQLPRRTARPTCNPKWSAPFWRPVSSGWIAGWTGSDWIP